MARNILSVGFALVLGTALAFGLSPPPAEPVEVAYDSQDCLAPDVEPVVFACGLGGLTKDASVESES